MSDSTQHDAHLAYLHRKLDLHERALNLKERELDQNDRMLAHRIEAEEKHAAEMAEAKKGLDRLQEIMAGQSADDFTPLFPRSHGRA